ncbi:MAG: SMP-30/gluconolactonase/LRE family protein [Akkermansiaceae bacterium]
MNLKYTTPISLGLTLSLACSHLASAQAQPELIDMVELGKETFHAKGCVECHSVIQGDTSFKTGPNLYQTFQLKPAQHQVIDTDSNKTISLAADFLYLQSSLSNPASHLAINTQGDIKGIAYQPIMPAYSKAIMSTQEKRSLYDYFLTLNPKEKAGPAKRMVEKGKQPPYNPDTAADSVNARDTTVVYRAFVNNGTSARGIHIGQTNAQNYSFDPSTLGIDAIWTGRFLDIRGEIKGRGGKQSKMGIDSRPWPKQYKSILAPLTTKGKPFSAALLNSYATDLPTDTQAFADKLPSITGKLTSYTTTDKPTISYTLDGNQVNLTFVIDTNGTLNATITGELKQPLTLTFPPKAFKNIQASTGKIDNQKGTWTLTTLSTPVTWTAIPNNPITGEDKGKLLPQVINSPFAWTPSNNKGQDIIQGFSITEAQGPTYASETTPLFEPLAIEFEQDGTPVIGSRAAGIWKIKNNQWQPYALGAYDVLGLTIMPDGDLIVAQKPEISRISDTDKDGTADTYQTLTDQFRFAGNYHAFNHGPAIDKDGNIHFNLNIQHAGDRVYSIPKGSDMKHSAYKAGGKYMGASGGYRGWNMQLTTDGKTIPYASGLRSPAGLAFSPDDKLYYTENQGEFVGTSRLYVIEKDKFYGNPSGLIDLPGETPATLDKRRDELINNRQLPSVLFPHALVANSPGHPVWDTTKGKFGPFTGQIFVGDQTLSNIHRVSLETVNGIEQGCVLPFVTGLPSGAMRLTFSPTGEMWVGQTGRGWASKGGNLAALQKITWDNKTSQAIHRIEARKYGFEIFFTQPVDKSTQDTYNSTVIESWYYENSSTYGSKQHDKTQQEIEATRWSTDNKSVQIAIKDFTKTNLRPTPSATPRLYRINLKSTAFGSNHSDFQSTAYYTLITIPKK